MWIQRKMIILGTLWWLDFFILITIGLLTRKVGIFFIVLFGFLLTQITTGNIIPFNVALEVICEITGISLIFIAGYITCKNRCEKNGTTKTTKQRRI